jgi:hypothetical protein
MSGWDIFSFVIDLLMGLANWRFFLCFFGSLILAFIVVVTVPLDPLNWIVAGLIFVVGSIVGWRWDDAR